MVTHPVKPEEPSMDHDKHQGSPSMMHRPIFVYGVPFLALAVGIIIQLAPEPFLLQSSLVEVLVSVLATVVLLAAVFAVLHHAESLAARLGEPYGTLLLTIAVTIIEVSIIVSVMLHGTPNPAVAREAVFSVVMIVCTGLIGTCLTL